jgi:hypothetical protein
MIEPMHHHCIPLFYLSRWVSADQRVCRLNRPHGNEVKAKRVIPEGGKRDD